jgi:hypothetical protein
VRRIFSVFALVFSLCAANAHAETYRLSYEAAVLGVVVLGEARYEVAATPTRFAVRGHLRTSGLARLFDQTEISASSAGVVNGVSLAWTRYDLTHAYADKSRRVLLTRAGAGVASQVTPRFGDLGQPPASMAQQYGSYDPLTALFALGRQVGAARACTGSVLVFDGRGHYRLAVSPRGTGDFNGGGYSGPIVQCAFRYEPIAGFDFTEADRARIPVAEAWFALPPLGGFAPPVRLIVPTPLGDAQLDLRGYENLG